MEGASEGLWDWSVQTGETFYSPRWFTLLGYSPDEFPNRIETLFDLLHPMDLNRVEKKIYDNLGSSQGFTIEFRMRHKDGAYRWILSRGKTMEFDVEGQPVRAVGTHVDITERKIAEESIVSAKFEAERANLEKSKFLSRMSHELRTPMNSILGFSQLLELDESMSSVQREHVRRVLSAGNHLLSLIDEVLDLSTIESGKVNILIENISLTQVFEETVEIISSMIKKKNIKLTVAPEIENAVVTGDRMRLKQVLVNLASNAVKYNRDEGEVVLGCRKADAGKVEIFVSDTGIGIPEYLQESIFEPFRRLEQNNADGVGIGLTICKNLVHLMNGTIALKSDPGQGSCFSVFLPEGVSTGVTAEETSNNRDPVMPLEKRDPRCILYIEDNVINLRLIKQIYDERPDIRFLSAPNAEEGIELSRAERPDLILMDINMPGMDGREAFSALKKHPETASIPVVALTANAMEKDKKRAMEMGFTDYISKPIQIPHLVHTVDFLLKSVR
jgi:PAS domain S-box-containing protein